jgi:hypothetical protein
MPIGILAWRPLRPQPQDSRARSNGLSSDGRDSSGWSSAGAEIEEGALSDAPTKKRKKGQEPGCGG